MSQRRNEDGYRNQNFGGQGHQQQGARSNWDQQGGQPGAGQFGGRQDQHSQYSGGQGAQYGGAPFGGQRPGNPYGNPYDQPSFAQGGQERQWGPSNEQDRFQGGPDYNERQFSDHYGAAGDPYRNAGPQAGWTPPSQHRNHYGSRGFGATGHGTSDYSGLGAFEVGPGSDDRRFNQQQFDQFGREQLGSQRFAHQDPHYRQWRDEQLRRFDDDYQQWHQERYQNFSNDFDDWRSRRQGTQAQGSGTSRAVTPGSDVGDLSNNQPDQHKGSSKGQK